MNLFDAFMKCLSLKDRYIHVENAGDYYVERKGDCLKLFFEWSDGTVDWANNFDFPAKPYKHMENLWFCHRGFLKVWKSIEPYIVAEISNPEIKKIEIVGYSHGAAMALLCYEYCIFHRPDVDVQGVGFGCPRVFWGFVPELVKERFRNFTVVRNGNDIVTHVPPAIFGFRHISKIIQIGQDKSKGIVNDHRPENYLENLK